MAGIWRGFCWKDEAERRLQSVILIDRHLWRYAAYRAYLNLAGEASKYFLGWLWWFLEPIALTAVFFLVFSYLRPMRSDVENFPAFLIVGVTTWLWFANAVANSTNVLVGARAIVSQMRLPKLLFPTIAVVAASLKQGFVFAVLLVFLGVAFGAAWTWLFLPLLACAQFVLILATAGTVAFVCCCVRDLRFVVQSGLTLMMFCSGLFFAIEDMPAKWQPWLRLNPMAVMLEQYRSALLYETAPDWAWCVKVLVFGGVWLFGLQRIYEGLDRTLTRRIIA